LPELPSGPLSSATLEAAAIGPGVPPGSFPVRIHSVFPHAVNLQPFAGGNLITILSRPSAGHPQSISLATTEDFIGLGLLAQSSGRCDPSGIVLDRPNAHPLRISFALAIRARLLPLPALRQLDASWEAAVTMLAALQVQAGTDLRISTLLDRDPAQGLLGQRLAAAALALGGSVRAGALDPARGAVTGLVGLGRGLTPSGDDFLCGFMTAAHCRCPGDCDAGPFLRGLQQVVLDHLPATNAISATLLRCAVEGKACAALAELAQALQGGRELRSALVGLCAFGHSSGMDIATGFLYGLSVWI
jgi:hypothetical protein